MRFLNALLRRNTALPPAAGAAAPDPALAGDAVAAIAERDRLRAMLDTNSDWIWEVDAEGRYTFASAHIEALLGYRPEEVLGRTPFDLMPPEEAARIGTIFAGIAARKAPFSGLLNRNRHADGRIIVLETSGVPLLAEDGRLLGYRGVDRDVTEREARTAQIAWAARHDSLTGLANRTEFQARLEERLAQGEATGLLLLDLDFFKEVNDQLGHASGDVLLRQVAQRLDRLLPEGSLGARLGGDEFAALLAAGPEQAQALAQHLSGALCEPYQLEGRSAVIGVSCGLALAPRHAGAVSALLRCADLALYQAKQEGRGHVCLYGPQLEARQRTDEGLEAALRRAIAQEDISLCYRPLRDLADGRVRGCFAEPGWWHPVQGAMPAEAFLGLADRTGLVLPLGAQLLRRACRAARDWPAEWRLTLPVTAVQLRDPSFPALVQQVLQETGLPPARLEMAVSEASLGQGAGPLPRALRKLRELGIGLALDRFGEGAVSLGLLQRFRFDRLRLAPALTEALPREPEAGMVAAILLLAGRLGARVTALGTLGAPQRAALHALGCQEEQDTAAAEVPPG
ncbi:bifunctional diguanylate cyclase/phosphodiesterase [Pseudoroseomonas cervicalis]|uniref:putative bifunctional diguanylate cyclase/phosphodiesterase n=1 Tax=Teichococcus cervicalis TaxID=204525 RepID=UPI00278567BE|nr:diguanylate cyclase [Pseudoroseomonas cervicalis]MDQ1078209.1 diguanylate cyclase (GGDEF)-like protein/PAS domain S-box-containing protein [Pseudoroseomonas cervicalis]